jgi:hypothetical protein
VSTSVVFAVRTTVKTVFTTALAGTSVQVFGGPLEVAAGKDAIYIGVDDLTDELGWVNAIDAKQDWHSNLSRLEDFDLKCVALSWSGGSDFDAAFTAMGTYMGLVERALLNDPGLSNTLAFAGLSIVGVDQINGPNGVAVKCRFSVIGQARIS